MSRFFFHSGSLASESLYVDCSGKVMRFGHFLTSGQYDEKEGDFLYYFYRRPTNKDKLFRKFSFTKIKQISNGTNHMLLLTHNNVVYSVGKNHKAQLGHGRRGGDPTNSFEPVKFFAKKKTVEVASGTWHSLFRTDNGIFACGYNQKGGGGCGHFNDWITTPEKVLLPNDVRIIKMCGGHFSSYFLSDIGVVYITGSIHLGRNAEEHFKIPRKIDSIKERVVEISAGNFHFLCLTSEGKVYGIGSNFHGQLCYTGKKKEKKNLNEMTLINTSSIKGVIKQISCGFDHSMCLTRDGRVACWGKNFFGQLGIGKWKGKYGIDQYEPIVDNTPGMVGISQIYASGDNSFCITKNGRVWVTGNNMNGQTGLGISTKKIYSWKENTLIFLLGGIYKWNMNYCIDVIIKTKK